MRHESSHFDIGIRSPEPWTLPPFTIDPDDIERRLAEERRYRMGPPPPTWIADDHMRPPREPLQLVLYVSANSTACVKAIQTLHDLLRHFPENYAELRILDVASHVEAAANDRVLFTPTLLWGRGLPRVRVIGDLSNRSVLVDLLRSAGLDLDGH